MKKQSKDFHIILGQFKSKIYFLPHNNLKFELLIRVK